MFQGLFDACVQQTVFHTIWYIFTIENVGIW